MLIYLIIKSIVVWCHNQKKYDKTSILKTGKITPVEGGEGLGGGGHRQENRRERGDVWGSGGGIGNAKEKDRG